MQTLKATLKSSSFILRACLCTEACFNKINVFESLIEWPYVVGVSEERLKASRPCKEVTVLTPARDERGGIKNAKEKAD